MEADKNTEEVAFMEDIISVLKTISVLYVEDDCLVLESIGRFLKRRCKVVYEAENGKVGLELYRLHDVDIVITDLEMPVMNGFQMIKSILDTKDTQPIVITTGYSDDEHKVEDACAHIIKPIAEDELVRTILHCLGKLA
ncbi:MAG: response regulator [Nitrospirae bacterium]|nr:response regulator [Nitrospirota bacterium]